MTSPSEHPIDELLLLAPLEEPALIAQRLAEVGLHRFTVMYKSGEVGRTTCAVRDTIYTRALDEVRLEEDEKRLPVGTTEHVLSLVLTGEFDSSDWASWYGRAPESQT